MSLNPVYLWNPQNFPDPQAMLPDGFDAAHRIVSEWADQPLPQGADTSAFDKLAEYIAEAARSGKASADFKAAYTDIETQIAEQLKSRAILELYEHYLELMPILTCRSESLGLVLYDANGYLLLPDGREYPEQETQVGEQLKNCAILEPYEHYLELMPILTCRSESLGLVLYDANGYLLLPEAGSTPTKKQGYLRQCEAEEQQ